VAGPGRGHHQAIVKVSHALLTRRPAGDDQDAAPAPAGTGDTPVRVSDVTEVTS
jgi:hypothetical protein